MLRPAALRSGGAGLWSRGLCTAVVPTPAPAPRLAAHGAGPVFGGRAAPSRQSFGPRRSFATAAFTVPAQGRLPEQTLFVVGLNEGKFFGQDGAEEGLKLLERVAEHHQEYELLFGLNEKELAWMEADHKVKNNRLTPSRELERAKNCEMIPLVQAGMVDRIPRKAIGRSVKTTQGHVAWMLWKHPREAVKLYWAYWKRKEYKDAARRTYWSKVFPNCGYAYFEERAEIISIRTVEHLVLARAKGGSSAVVLAVGNELFEPVSRHLGIMLGEGAVSQLGSAAFSQQLQNRATDLLADVPDLTPVLIFFYAGLPLLIGHFAFLGTQYYASKLGLWDKVLEVERRD